MWTRVICAGQLKEWLKVCIPLVTSPIPELSLGKKQSLPVKPLPDRAMAQPFGFKMVQGFRVGISWVCRSGAVQNPLLKICRNLPIYHFVDLPCSPESMANILRKPPSTRRPLICWRCWESKPRNTMPGVLGHGSHVAGLIGRFRKPMGRRFWWFDSYSICFWLFLDVGDDINYWRLRPVVGKPPCMWSCLYKLVGLATSCNVTEWPLRRPCRQCFITFYCLVFAYPVRSQASSTSFIDQSISNFGCLNLVDCCSSMSIPLPNPSGNTKNMPHFSSCFGAATVPGRTVQYILSQQQLRTPASGTDKGDHPPITPMKAAHKEYHTAMEHGNWKMSLCRSCRCFP